MRLLFGRAILEQVFRGANVNFRKTGDKSLYQFIIHDLMNEELVWKFAELRKETHGHVYSHHLSYDS